MVYSKETLRSIVKNNCSEYNRLVEGIVSKDITELEMLKELLKFNISYAEFLKSQIEKYHAIEDKKLETGTSGYTTAIFIITCPCCSGNAFEGELILTSADIANCKSIEIECALCHETFDYDIHRIQEK